MTPRRQEQRKKLAAKKKWQLAQKLESAEMLVAALAFYCGRLEPGALTDVEKISCALAGRPRRWKRYLRAARRILGIEFHHDRTLVRLPRNYLLERLPRAGLKLALNPSKLERFQSLNCNLELDDQIRAFAASHPTLLERTQLLLEEKYRPSIAERLNRPDAAALKEQKAASDRFWLPKEEPLEARSANLAELLAAPGPFASKDFKGEQESREHEELLGAVREEATIKSVRDEDDNYDPDDQSAAYTSPFKRTISRKALDSSSGLRRARESCRESPEQECHLDDRESCYVVRVRTKVLNPHQLVTSQVATVLHPYAEPVDGSPPRGSKRWHERGKAFRPAGRLDPPHPQSYPFPPATDKTPYGQITTGELLKGSVRTFLARKAG